MEVFYKNTAALPEKERKDKLDKIVGFFRQHNAHPYADAFKTLRDCYADFPVSKRDVEWRAYHAWSAIFDLPPNPVFQHVVNQG